LLTCLLSGPVAADRLTLEEALAAVSAAHPDRRMAESDLTLALTERDQALSRTDFNLYLDGALRMGLRPSEFGGDWESNNEARIVARKSLWISAAAARAQQRPSRKWRHAAPHCSTSTACGASTSWRVISMCC
jgi:hypothetical protein